ncbi:hypothetical protein [Leisingera sp. NJS204]|uniref:hypothetical protein n=1 Tax=Leisingera sp. NJS204 TaxID=2508307 RepID=UPI001011518A|nr:hypothetical protein [Leisingera sp. NJS204]QAX29284.1 hypothetical protein ETW24_07910 [Leisingera sp. NJS204]
MKNKAKIIRFLGTVAPTVAAALGGPMAGVAVDALATQFMGRQGASSNEVEQAILGASAADLAKLKQVDAEFAAQLQAAGIELERIAADDRASARARQVQTRDWVPGVLAAAVIVGFFVVLAYVSLYELPAATGPVVTLLIGSLATGLSQVLNFYFGSSVGSKNKDAVIAGMKGGAA